MAAAFRQTIALLIAESDFWEAYQLVIPSPQHTAAGKESGETAHVERWNNTLRQRLGRFGVRVKSCGNIFSASLSYSFRFSL
ncbi:MAG: hypothetical protein WKF84_18070 [Pyrinomonadaceae bacterium]